MSQSKLIEKLYKIGCIQFGNFTLKSGATSAIYINLRKLISYPDLLPEIATAMWEKISQFPADLICGVPYTALPIATCISIAHKIPMVMRRKEKKAYGTKQMIEGQYHRGQTCAIIEDVVTSGASIIETAVDLEDEGLVIKNIVTLVDREQNGKANLGEKKYQLHAVMTLSEILTYLANHTLLSPEEQNIVQTMLKERRSNAA